MLVTKERVAAELAKYGIEAEGALHVGSHDCEELDFYKFIGLNPSDVVWLDALEDKVQACKARGIPNVYQAVVSDKDDETVIFRRTNNDQSSSILEFGTHAQSYPYIHVVSSTEMKTTTLDSFVIQKNLDASKWTVWNFDIQGAELKALQGAEGILSFAKALYLEVNTQEVYKGCAVMTELDTYLEQRGFKRVITEMVNGHGWGDALYVRTGVVV